MADDFSAPPLTPILPSDGPPGTGMTPVLIDGKWRLQAASGAVLAGDVVGTEAATVVQSVAGSLKLLSTISPTAIAAQADNYAPTGFSAALLLRLTLTGDQSMTGLAGGADGRIVLFENIDSADTLTLVSQSSSSTAANRFALDADLALNPGEAIWLVYDGTSSRWRAVGLHAPNFATPTGNAGAVAAAGTATTALRSDAVIPVVATIVDPPAASTGDVVIDATAAPRTDYYMAPASDQTFDPTAATVSQRVTITKTTNSTNKLTVKVGAGASVAGFTVFQNGTINTNFDLPASATNDKTATHQWTLTIDVPNKLVYVAPPA